MRTFRLILVIAIACHAWRSASAEPPDAKPLKTSLGKTSLSILDGDRPLMQYRMTANPKKTYVEQLFSPSGAQVLRDAPHDHVHHHALMYAVGVDGVDFWSENEQCGHQQPQPVSNVRSAVEGGIPWAGFTQRLDWVDPNGEKRMVESRSISVCRPPNRAVTLLTWQSRLEPPPGKDSIVLGGSHYFGLGMRFVESMDTVGRHFNAAGKPGQLVRGDERLGRSRWSAYCAPADGKPVTVAMFDHPANPRHPAHFFTMLQHFAYISATQNISKEPLSIQAGQPLKLRYAVAVFDGDISEAEVEKLYQRWAKH